MRNNRIPKEIIEIIVSAVICLCAIFAYGFMQNVIKVAEYEEYVSQGYTVYINGVKVDKPDKVGDLSKFDEIVFDEENGEIYIYSE